MKGMLFRFLQIYIHISDELIDKFSEFFQLFVMDSIPDESIPSLMHEYQTRTGQKMIRGANKLLGVMCTKKILLYSPMLKCYLSHGLKVTAIHKYLKYDPGRPFSQFSEEVRRDTTETDLSLKQLSDTFKLNGNSFYGNMIEDIMKHLKTTFTIDKELVDKSFRSPFFKDLGEINTAFGIKFHMLEFYYAFLDKYLDWLDFELIQMNTDSIYMDILGEFNEIIRPELREYDHGRNDHLSLEQTTQTIFCTVKILNITMSGTCLLSK